MLRVTLRVCMNQNSFEGEVKAYSEKEIPSPKDLKALMVYGEHQGYFCYFCCLHQFYCYWHSEYSTSHLDHNLLAFSIVASR